MKTTEPRVTLTPLSQIVPSKTNRTQFDETAMSELVDSIRQHGVLQPIVLRPLNGSKFEIIAGERRWRACTALEHATIPATVREVTDAEALELQSIENLQRENIAPLDEAAAFDRLHRECKLTVEQIAAKVSRPPAHIKARLALLGLPQAAQDALWTGKLPEATAALLARIPDATARGKAFKLVSVQREEYDHASDRRIRRPASFQEAKAQIEREFCVSMRKAQFNLKDDQLVPLVEKAGERVLGGACAGCPFHDTEAKVCMQPACFHTKQEADWKRLVAIANKEGCAVLTQEEVKAAFPYGEDLSYNSKYIEAEGTTWDYNKAGDHKKPRTWASLLAKCEAKLVRPILARTPRGKIVRLLLKSEVAEALKAIGLKSRNDSDLGGSSRDATPEDRRKQRSKQACEKRTAAIAAQDKEFRLRHVVDSIAGRKEVPVEIYPFITEAITAPNYGGNADNALEKTIDRRFPLKSGTLLHYVTPRVFAALKDHERAGFTLEIALRRLETASSLHEHARWTRPRSPGSTRRSASVWRRRLPRGMRF